MDQINYRQEYKRLLSAYRTNGEITDNASLQTARALIDKFPYCQPVHLIYASGLKNDSVSLESYLPKISLLTPLRENLYQAIHHPDKIIAKGTIAYPEKGNFKAVEVEQDITEQFSGRNNSEYINHTENNSDDPDLETGEDESLFIDSIVSDDIFSPVSSESTDTADATEESKPAGGLYAPELQNMLPGKGIHNLSMYHDDKMPFTFLWWLNKTRKENSETYQPYVSFKLDTTRPISRNANDELNQQIMENIFHLQVPVDDPQDIRDSRTVEFKVKRKDEELIEKFIKQDPQIRPMQPDKISTENMARKSSEDLNNVVSETLARIYVEQMLFDKAIDAYKKLSLKFPEKNAYFADQISDLEKKIN